MTSNSHKADDATDEHIRIYTKRNINYKHKLQPNPTTTKQPHAHITPKS